MNFLFSFESRDGNECHREVILDTCRGVAYLEKSSSYRSRISCNSSSTEGMCHTVGLIRDCGYVLSELTLNNGKYDVAVTKSADWGECKLNCVKFSFVVSE